MEACFVNLVEPGDTVIIGVNGVFGERMCEVAQPLRRRSRARRSAVGPRRRPPAAARRARRRIRKRALVAVVHAETSTGVENDIAPLAAIRDTDTLLLVDMVTSLGGIPVEVDAWGIDAVYSGTQKCLGVPPGLSPVSFSDRAVERIRSRANPPQSWYLDLGLIADYVGSARRYHHTAPISMLYALHAGLGVLLDEGLEASWARHALVGAQLQAALPELGFRLFAEERRLPQLTSVWLPEGVDDAKLRGQLLQRFDIEVGGGLGDLAGKGWRIGLMGHGAREHSVAALSAP